MDAPEYILEAGMNKLAKVLDAESYEWLYSQHPTLADAVEAEVNAGATPAEIRRFVLRHTGGRLEIAYRCEAAARYLQAKAEPVSALERYGVRE